jgi:glycosyltransferase involved in cell wall biosynthesis
MKRIVIVNNNMKVGGVQKSLYNLLWSLDGQYDVTLCLLRATGAYLEHLPAGVKVVECSGAVKYLSMSQGECRGIHKLLRGGWAFLCRILGRDRVMKLILAATRKFPGEYDCALAFLHNGTITSFYGGVQEFVLKKVDAKKKVAFLHCDYSKCGANHPRNNQILKQFDRIAACSEGCRKAFINCLPELESRCVTVPNFHRYDEIRTLAQPAAAYEPGAVHGVCVARLAHEKGIERAIAATAAARDAGFDFRLHLVGGGGMEEKLRGMTEELDLTHRVIFHGEQSNPYPYMAGADLFLLTSFHEAAPMVIDEAVCLFLPVLTVKTTSSHEMVTARQAGWVCENDQAALNEALLGLLAAPETIQSVKTGLQSRIVDNTAAAKQVCRLIEE